MQVHLPFITHAIQDLRVGYKALLQELVHICFASHAAAFREHEYTDKDDVFMGNKIQSC